MDNDSYGDERYISRLKDLAERLLDHGYHLEVDSDKPQLFLGELPTATPEASLCRDAPGGVRWRS